MALKIRRLTADDDCCGAVRDFVVQNFSYMEGVIDPPSSARLLSEDAVRRQASEAEVYVVEEGDLLVGSVFFSLEPPALYIGKLAVHPDYRQRGIARLLLHKAETLARERDLSELKLLTRVELTANHEAFGKLGFVRSGSFTHEGYAQPTSIEMRKALRDI